VRPVASCAAAGGRRAGVAGAYGAPIFFALLGASRTGSDTFTLVSVALNAFGLAP
jgi:hypothetical protein